MEYHLYADDNQLCITFDGADSSSRLAAISQIESCVVEVKEWMLHNILKLNGDKTEFLYFLPNYLKHTDIPSPSVTIGSDSISTSSTAKNLGVLLDDNLSLEHYITSMVKAANFQLYRLSHIKQYLTPEACCMAVHSLVSSRVDYCNSLLVGLPKTQTNKLQHIINCAVHLVSVVGKFGHITPILESLHWLPVEY